MSLYRKNPKRDKNERKIIEALEFVGCSVRQLSLKGFPDLCVAYKGKNYLMEVKDIKGKLTPDQEQGFSDWMGEIHIVRTEADALKAIGIC